MREDQMKTSSIHEIASRNILTYLREGRLIQDSWYKIVCGREAACLLAAAAGVDQVSDCPVDLMPRWLAETTQILYNKLDLNDVKETSLRYGQLIEKWFVVTDDGWDRVLARYLVKLIDQALDAVPEIVKVQKYWPAIEKSTSDCKRAISAYDKDSAFRYARVARYTADMANYSFRFPIDYTTYNAALRGARAAYAASHAAYTDVVSATDIASAAIALETDNDDDNRAAKSLFSALLDEIEPEISTSCAS